VPYIARCVEEEQARQRAEPGRSRITPACLKARHKEEQPMTAPENRGDNRSNQAETRSRAAAARLQPKRKLTGRTNNE
jgi:hypothetical protein